jgi:ABC transporter
VIEIEGLRKGYRRFRGPATVAVDGLDLSVPTGGVFGFLGPNGAGKTTTIRTLLGLARPTAGHCRVFGVDSQHELHRVQRRVGTMIETQALFLGFVGRRNLGLLAGMEAIPESAVDDALDLAGSNFEPLRPWMMYWDATVFVKGRFEAGGDVPGRSTLEAGGVLLAYALGVTVVALWAFPQPRRRLTYSHPPLLPTGGSRAPDPALRAQPSPVRKPSRQVGYRSCQSSSRLALAFEEPRIWVIIETP